MFTQGAIVQWWTMISIVAADIAAYFGGKRWGKTKLIKVSPNKTWEGFIGGMVVTLGLAVLLAPWLTALPAHSGPLGLPETVSRWVGPLLAGLVIAVAGFFGDINMSGLKRDCGAKDSSAMLPGMGGLIDRIDSLTFAAPAFFYFMAWWMS